jgi:hypothetical protein
MRETGTGQQVAQLHDRYMMMMMMMRKLLSFNYMVAKYLPAVLENSPLIVKRCG